MHHQRMLTHACALPWIAVFGATLSIAQAQPVGEPPLIGVEMNSGTLYSISRADATLSEIGPTGLTGLGALEFNPNDGFLYGMTFGDVADTALYRIGISPSLQDVLSVDLIGGLGIRAFEGGLAFAPDGTAYALNGGVTVPALVKLDLGTGLATEPVFLDDRHDIGGLGWRSDGMLVGLDSTTNTLITIDPGTGVTATIQGTPAIGSVGGMYLDGDVGYFATAGPRAFTPGSNALYTFDAFGGTIIGMVGSSTWTDMGMFLDAEDTGISSLAIIPEPATLSLLLLGSLALLYRRTR